jgi:hypothetical protein
MTQADRVLSTPPTNTSATNPPGPVDQTRRGFITLAAGASIVSVGSLAAVAMPISTTAQAGPDPIFAAIDAFHRADAAVVAVDGDIPDELGDQCHEAYLAVVRTRPITPAGLAALTSWVREQTDWLSANSTHLPGEELCAIAAAVDDATRGMSGLEPWSPPPTAVVVSTPLGQHPDTELFAATDRYLAGLSEYAACALAFDEIEFIEPRPRGYVSKERAYLRTMKHFGKMERELVNIRPKTLDGLFAKARALEADRYVSEDLRESVLKDVLGMQPDRGKAVRS